MEIPAHHDVVAKLTLSGTDVLVGTYDDRGRSSSPSVWFQTEDNPEPIYTKVAEAKLLIAALQAVVDYLENGD